MLQAFLTPQGSFCYCSTGVGRTGTLVCLDMLMARLAMDAVPITTAAMISQLGMYRHGSIQTDCQYVWIIRLLVELGLLRKVISDTEIAGWVGGYGKYIGANNAKNMNNI
uniref:TYR_PHOSPHATASE_2 domain-containing protein n=1 Tax=Rhabditophanes sp. KR3021 TaxID=114890 RepID=A0AC35TWB1_9BILA